MPQIVSQNDMSRVYEKGVQDTLESLNLLSDENVLKTVRRLRADSLALTSPPRVARYERHWLNGGGPWKGEVEDA